MLDQIVLYPVADDELFAPGGRVVIRTYGFAKAAPGGDHPVAYRTWVTGMRDQPYHWRWSHYEEARVGHRRVLEWLTGRGPEPVPAARQPSARAAGAAPVTPA